MQKNEQYWKEKLMAFLHDPPHKPYGIAKHAETIKSNLIAFGLTEDDMRQFGDKFTTDAFAASADRFIFPNPRKGNLKTNWVDEGAPYIHPFCGTHLKPHVLPVTRDVSEDWMSSAINEILSEQAPTKDNFIKAWRLWEKRLVDNNGDAGCYMPYLVADTRIPDHTIWQHNALTAAVSGCAGKPAFLLFQIGPVQSFIAQAKTTRDLWAGSYILSYLNAKAISAVIDKYGPDHIIFPQIKGNPIIDKLFWDTYGQDLEFTADAQKQWQKKQLLIPSLPNRFMALVPANDHDIEAEIKKAVSDEWEEIESSVRKYMKNKMDSDFQGWDELWDEQVACFPRIDSIIHPFEKNEDIIKEFLEENSPPFDDPEKHSTITNLNWALKSIKDEFKDPRCYKHRYDKQNKKTVMLNISGEDRKQGDKATVDNLGFTWALQYMKAEWKFGALRNARMFNQRFDFAKEKAKEYQSLKRNVEKDPLDGINEVLGGKENKKFWTAVSEKENLRRYFKGKQRYGAITVIKRLFAKAYLNQDDVYDNTSEFRIKSTYEIATGRRVNDGDTLTDKDQKYYAAICLDGDSMGEWFSGMRAQPIKEQLLGKEIKTFFDDNVEGDLKRGVTPSYQSTFSEALANFANYCVEPIVSAFNGQLIYAGGDDVLVMVPAEKAIDCSEALQYAFRGVKPSDISTEAYKVLNGVFDFEWCEIESKEHMDGFLKLKNPGSARPKHPLLLPGPKTTVSVGIAVGHLKSPMQDLIQAARDAEKTAKDSGKDGFCLTIKKRSGETNSFFAHWNRISENETWQTDEIQNYCQLYSLWRTLEHDPALSDSSNRLPYIYTQYISPLMKEIHNTTKQWAYCDDFSKEAAEACKEFIRIVFERQTSLNKKKAGERVDSIWNTLNITNTTPENYINFWMCRAFMNRIKEGGAE